MRNPEVQLAADLIWAICSDDCSRPSVKRQKATKFATPSTQSAWLVVTESIRDEIVVMASGGIRTAHDVAKAIVCD